LFADLATSKASTTEEQTIPRGQPRWALSPSLQHQQLMPEGQGLCSHDSHAARLRQPDQRREQMGDQDEQLFHGDYITSPPPVFKTARGRARVSVLQFAYFRQPCRL
jgi:hypothetical protein